MPPLPLRLLVLLVGATPLSARAQPDADRPPLAPEAHRLLAAGLDSLQRLTLRRGTTDWAAVRDSAFGLAAGARRPEQAYGALNWALGRVDPHSFLQAPELEDLAAMLPADAPSYVFFNNVHMGEDALRFRALVAG